MGQGMGSRSRGKGNASSVYLQSSPAPAVTITSSKRKGTKAIQVVDRVLTKVNLLKRHLIPSDVQVTVTRNYRDPAEEKSTELLFHMMITIVFVSVLIMLTLGLRESGIVALTSALHCLYG
jgi:multidrug efflux pump subunit AcrB